MPWIALALSDAVSVLCAASGKIVVARAMLYTCGFYQSSTSKKDASESRTSDCGAGTQDTSRLASNAILPVAEGTQCAAAYSAKDGVHLVPRLVASRAHSDGQNRLTASALASSSQASARTATTSSSSSSCSSVASRR